MELERDVALMPKPGAVRLSFKATETRRGNSRVPEVPLSGAGRWSPLGVAEAGGARSVSVTVSVGVTGSGTELYWLGIIPKTGGGRGG